MAATAKLSEPIETRLFINGEFRPSSENKTFEVIYPFTKELVANVHEATTEDVNSAVAAANAAFPSWRDLGVGKRGEYLRKLSSLILESNDEFAKLETLCTGRPITQYIDAGLAAEKFRYFAETAWSAQGTASFNTPGFLNMTFKQPYGVAALIIPWNFPLATFSMKVAPALAAGNTVVLKSSEKAPLTVCLVWLPPGVVNVISGFGTPTGEAMALHMSVRCLSFTGSTLTGQKIQAAAAKSNLKHTHMELGGKSPAIVFEDADLEAAAAATQLGIKLNSGQVCVANSRVYVHESVAERFTQLFREKFAAIQMGDPMDPNTTHGPQIDFLQYNRVKEYLSIGQKDGTCTQGGDANNGFFVHPTVFERVPEDSRLMREEIFGPVVAINTFKTEEEAIEKANNTEFGLYASFFTKDMDRAMRLAKLIESGMVAVNCTCPSLTMDTAFGGVKMSGNGRDGYLYSLDEYLETKSVLVKMG
ncbi:hypothetical protein N7474_004026 [Penicillium riverlandense]|uniref:uncharacterized protein n=1 Tax=Penicillium riverlandense TaxID=1903569 RepID=UPI002549121A|nr:uncharacterized protein N7474_004026 [Penicillium riverlandense]KAJ5818435.1 hypothetical protein N7474_004026 [Penicillium riverlandense]